MRIVSWLLALSIGGLCLVPTPTSAEEPLEALKELSLDELLSMEITSVSKKPQRFFETPAAIYVITGEQLRRTGVRNIPDALRLVPGLQVASTDANTWAIASRGFTERFSGHLMVLIDGRKVYSTSTGAVYWNAHDVLLEDVQAIEVIRGPGGATWGANAVNGYINIITKKSSDETDGGYVTAGVGTEEEGFAALRFGASIGETGHVRAYAKAFSRGSFESKTEPEGHDDWDLARAGFRADWDLGDERVRLQGEAHDGRIRQRRTDVSFSPPSLVTEDDAFGITGTNLLGRWERDLARGDDYFQGYFDHYTNREIPSVERSTVVDLEYQRRIDMESRHEVVYGFGYRWKHVDWVDWKPGFLLDDNRDDHSFSALLQDEMSFKDDDLRLTVGVKLEHNQYSGFEYQPGLRMSWAPSERTAVWGAIARSVRTPQDTSQHSLVTLVSPPFPFPGPDDPPTFVRGIGRSQVDAEDVVAFEFGFRVQTGERLFVDTTLFYNDYSNLFSFPALDFGGLFVEGDYQVVPLSLSNEATGDSHGIEIAMQYEPTEAWRLKATYSYLSTEFSTDSVFFQEGEADPKHRASLWSSVDFGEAVEFDFWATYTDRLSAFDVDSYIRLDARLAWQVNDRFEVAVVGQNLWESEHTEFFVNTIVPAEVTRVERGGFVQGTYRW